MVLLIERSVRGVGPESEIQLALARALSMNGISHEREVRLSKSSRIDFLVGTIGIEVKVDGGISAVIRQLHRYAEFATVSELVLVSTRATLARVPTELNGKHVRVALLLGGIF